jgi:hypothetical protein
MENLSIGSVHNQSSTFVTFRRLGSCDSARVWVYLQDYEKQDTRNLGKVKNKDQQEPVGQVEKDKAKESKEVAKDRKGENSICKLLKR